MKGTFAYWALLAWIVCSFYVYQGCVSGTTLRQNKKELLLTEIYRPLVNTAKWGQIRSNFITLHGKRRRCVRNSIPHLSSVRSIHHRQDAMTRNVAAQWFSPLTISVVLSQLPSKWNSWRSEVVRENCLFGNFLYTFNLFTLPTIGTLNGHTF